MDISKLKQFFELLESEIIRLYSDYQKSDQSLNEIIVKDDKSKVTGFELSLQQIVIKLISDFFPGIPLYSEEQINEPLVFPTFVLDPIDGTREFLKGRPECCFSLAYLHSENWDDQKHFAFLFNPLTQEKFVASFDFQHVPTLFYHQVPLGKSLISRTEFERKKYQNPYGIHHRVSDESSLMPLGSIAYKLCYLACAQTQDIYSFNGKNIWDIAGGIVFAQFLLKEKFTFFEYDQVQTLIKPFYRDKLRWTSA